MLPANNALWLPAKQLPEMTIGEAPYHAPGPNEVVIQTKAVAINPADVLLQSTGMLLTKYPAILGCDVAGVVEEIGADLAVSFKRGDRVIGSTGPLEHYKHSAFQEYVVLKPPVLCRIPDDVAFTDGVVLPLGVTTAASCLFGEEMLNLQLPPSNLGAGKILLIWGASSSVGCCGLQLAAAAGYEVYAVASSRNHGLLTLAGATQCFDYRSKTLIADIMKSVGDKEVVGAMDIISTDETLNTLCDILHQSGGRKFIASVIPGADGKGKLNVTVRTNFANDITINGIGATLWNGFMEAALADGRFQYKPNAEIVGHGLEDVQKAVNLLAQGVSAKKLVVTL